ncbi:hypothetical protein L1049_006263 [Liquidambar formosana]|uniref:Uncharacterized protein n=1 Tax=Liquidambar formosana TaxID=63359 RepID=A0AAP0WQT1_LIQFO
MEIGVAVTGSGTESGLDVPPGFRPLSNLHIPVQPNVIGDFVGLTFAEEPSTPFCEHNTSMGLLSSGEPPSEPVKRKRGRPWIHGSSRCLVALGTRRARERPPGTGWWQKLAASSAIRKRGRGRPLGTGWRQKFAASSAMRKQGRGLLPLGTGWKQKLAASLELSCESIKRKRGRPRMYGSSPWPRQLVPTGKQGRGRPPGTGWRQQLAASIAQEELEIGKDQQASQYDHREERTRSPSHQQSHSFNASLHHMLSAFNGISNMGQGNSAANGTMEKVGSYVVDPSLSMTLQAIMNKHGDIAKDCNLQSNYMRTPILEGICRVVQDLQNIPFINLKEHHLQSFYSAINDAERVKLNVRWLRQRLDEIVEAVNAVAHFKNVKDAKAKNMQQQMESIKRTLELKKVDMMEHQSAIQALEGQLASETLEIENLENSITDIKSKYSPFHRKCLMDGLL